MSSPARLTWRSFLTIEPVICLYFYALFMSKPTLQQFVYYRFSISKGFPYDPSEKKGFGCPSVNITNGTNESMEDEVQLVAARFNIIYVMTLSIPSILVSLLVGPWSDTAGRKPTLAAPVIGALLEAVTVIIVMYTGWPIYVLFIGSFINGCSGFFTVMTQATTAYIADSTPVDKVALRMAVMQLIVLVGGLVSQVTSGLWISRFGFIPPYWFMMSCQLVAILYLVFFVPETVTRPQKENRVRFFSLTAPRIIWRVFSDYRDGFRKSLVFLLIGDGIVSLGTMGIIGVMVLFVLRSPLCWSPTILGGFMAFRFLTLGIGGLIGIGLLKRCLSDTHMSRIGLVSLAVSLVVFAFANKTWIVFLAPLIGCLNGMVSPVLRGMMTRITRSDERGTVFAAGSALCTLCNFAGAFVLNPIYIWSLTFGFPGLVFLISAGLAMVPLIMMSFIKNTEYFEAAGCDVAAAAEDQINKENKNENIEEITPLHAEIEVEHEKPKSEENSNKQEKEKDVEDDGLAVHDDLTPINK